MPLGLPVIDEVRVRLRFSESHAEFDVPTKGRFQLIVRPSYGIRTAVPQWTFTTMTTVIDIIGMGFMDVTTSNRELSAEEHSKLGVEQHISQYQCAFGEAEPTRALRIHSHRLQCLSSRYKAGRVKLDVLLPWQGESWHSKGAYEFEFVSPPDIKQVFPLVVAANADLMQEKLTVKGTGFLALENLIARLSWNPSEEAKNRPNIDWQDEMHREILRGLGNISETP